MHSNSNDKNPTLPPLKIEDADAGLRAWVWYDTGAGIWFSAQIVAILGAHTSEVAVGAHPYATVTVVRDKDFGDALTGVLEARDITPADISNRGDIGLDLAQVLTDWVEYCDDVMATAERLADDDESLTRGQVVSCLPATWNITDDIAVERVLRADRREQIDDALADFDAGQLARVLEATRAMARSDRHMADMVRVGAG